jgi:hypothetical protein
VGRSARKRHPPPDVALASARSRDACGLRYGRETKQLSPRHTGSPSSLATYHPRHGRASIRQPRATSISGSSEYYLRKASMQCFETTAERAAGRPTRRLRHESFRPRSALRGAQPIGLTRIAASHSFGCSSLNARSCSATRASDGGPVSQATFDIATSAKRASSGLWFRR